MPQPFSRTLRSLEADRSRRGPWIALAGIVVLAAWATWAFAARVAVFAESSDARLAVRRAVFVLEAPIDGPIETVSAALDQRVARGDVLFQLDDRGPRLARDDAAARIEALEAEIASARAELEAVERTRAQDVAVLAAARREGELVLQRTELEKRMSEEELRRLEELRGSGAVAELSISKARTEVEKKVVEIDAQRSAVERLGLQGVRDESDLAARLAGLARTVAEREGALASARSALRRHEHEIELCKVRAPADGTIGEIAPLAPGAFVAAGGQLATVLAEGRVAVEARFTPRDALGRVRAGQAAELALDGFPRVEFGALPLVVERVAGEARDGRVQVELAVQGDASARLPREHGLPGSVRVEIERAAPAALLLRAVGRAWSTEAASAPPTSETSRDG